LTRLHAHADLFEIEGLIVTTGYSNESLDKSPEALIALYKKAGAKFFAAMANHHDNLDMWDSTYQPWNSVAVGPKKNMIAGWEKAVRAAGLRFAISCHGDRAWDWLQDLP
jgi:alpha-L-fucosidase